MPTIDVILSFVWQKLAALDNFIGIEMDDEFAASMADDVLDLMPPMDQWSGAEFGKWVPVFDISYYVQFKGLYSLVR